MIHLMSYNYKRAVEHGMDKRWIGRLISLRSSPYTHSEILFSDGVSFSSTMEDGANGARYLKIDYTKHPERWDSVAIPMTHKDEEVVRRKADIMDGKMKYDLWGLLSFGTPLSIIKPDPNKMWCSEICGYLIQRIHRPLPITPDLTHPTLLHESCQQYFCPEEIE